MFLPVVKIAGLFHPLVASAYLKRDSHGNTLVIETNFDAETEEERKEALDSLLVDLGRLIEEVEGEVLNLDTVDIRMNETTH